MATSRNQISTKLLTTTINFINLNPLEHGFKLQRYTNRFLPHSRKSPFYHDQPLTLVREMSTVYCENHTKRTHTVWQNTEKLNITGCGIYHNNRDSKG